MRRVSVLGEFARNSYRPVKIQPLDLGVLPFGNKSGHLRQGHAVSRVLGIHVQGGQGSQRLLTFLGASKDNRNGLVVFTELTGNEAIEIRLKRNSNVLVGNACVLGTDLVNFHDKLFSFWTPVVLDILCPGNSDELCLDPL